MIVERWSRINASMEKGSSVSGALSAGGTIPTNKWIPRSSEDYEFNPLVVSSSSGAMSPRVYIVVMYEPPHISGNIDEARPPILLHDLGRVCDNDCQVTLL